ncbi:hypothetical protein FQZ97_1068830 [compost metagenome]
MALRSERFQRCMRTLCRMTSSMSLFISPRRYSFTGGMRMPSSQIELALVGRLPGTLPPTSDMWPNMAA